MVQTYQPPTMETQDTIPELLPIFNYLNSHANKLYQEGYFLKLHDLDIRTSTFCKAYHDRTDGNAGGKPSAERAWTECFAQLVGTVLNVWDANELDAAGEEGEVIPTFINLTDASIKMVGTISICRSCSESSLNQRRSNPYR